MNHSGDAAEQIVRMSLEGVDYAIRIAGTGAKNIASLIMAVMKTQKSKSGEMKVSGQERLKKMLKSGKPLDVFPVREKDLQLFTQEAKKYGIVYCAVREKTPREDGMVDVMVCKDDAPKINRVMERLQYATLDKATIRSEIVQSREEQSTPEQPEAPDRADTIDVDRFLDSVMIDEGKTKQGQTPAEPPPPQQAAPEGERKSFFRLARAKRNPSAHGLEPTSKSEGTKNTAAIEPPSVKGELDEIRAELRAKKRHEGLRRDKEKKRRNTPHRQPKSKMKTHKER